MKNLYYYLFFVSVFFVSCQEQAPLSGTITVNSNNDWKSMVYLIQPPSFEGIASSYVGVIVDSTEIKANGHFVFNQMPDATTPILLQIAVQKKGERFLNKLENDDFKYANYLPIIWKNGETLQVTANIDAFQKSFSIKNPTTQNQAILDLRDIRQIAHEKFLAKKTSDVEEHEVLKEEEKLLKFQQSLMDFALEMPHLLPSLVAIRWVSIEGDYERIPEFIFNQAQKWQKIEPDNPFVIQLSQKGSRAALPILKGDTIPNYKLPMLAGDEVPLYELFGQKLTLIDLWASWCAPCRSENRNYLVPLWDEYQNKGFQIIGYAIDADEKVWKTAIQKDGADRWFHASHLNGDDSPLFSDLKITTIPANFLVNKNGKIVAKNLHGEELKTFVKNWMKK